MNEGKVKLRGVNLEGRVDFDFHVNVKRTSKKCHVLARLCMSRTRAKRNDDILINALIMSEFS